MTSQLEMRLALCLALVSAVFATPLELEKRLVGADVYPEGEYKYHVSLWYHGPNNNYNTDPELPSTLGGALLNENWVLTQTACNNYINGITTASNWKAAVGMYAQTRADEQAQIKDVDRYVYPRPETELCGEGSESTLLTPALMHLSSPVDMSSRRVDTAVLNTDHNCPSVGQRCTVIGWGQTQPAPYGGGSNLPRELEVTIMDNDHCADVYRRHDSHFIVDHTSLCTRADASDEGECFGDGGNPLICTCQGERKVVGVVTGALNPRRCGHRDPVLYSRVSAYTDFIQNTIEQD